MLIDMRAASVPPIPGGNVAPIAPDLAALRENEIAWLGHACFAIRMAGKLVVTDPYLTDAAGLFGLGPRRFIPPAVAAADLPRADLIVISHNHYDHIDGAALRA